MRFENSWWPLDAAWPSDLIILLNKAACAQSDVIEGNEP